jgi:quercetin dioxygenase-like cupin family protein
MATRRSVYLIALLAASAGLLAVSASSEGAEAVQILPDQITWAAAPTEVAPGTEVAVLSGPLDKPGFYAQRVRLKSGGMVTPHTHPDTRYVTVLSGELYVGHGEKMEADQTTKYPAGSYFVVPAGVVHYVWARSGEVVYQESGIGPTATNFLKK